MSAQCCLGAFGMRQFIWAYVFQGCWAGLRSDVIFQIVGGQPNGQAHFLLYGFFVDRSWRQPLKEGYQY